MYDFVLKSEFKEYEFINVWFFVLLSYSQKENSKSKNFFF